MRVVEFSIGSTLFIFTTSSVFIIFLQTVEKQFKKRIERKYNIEFWVLLRE